MTSPAPDDVAPLLDRLLACPADRRPGLLLESARALSGGRAASLWVREDDSWRPRARSGDLHSLPHEGAVRAALEGARPLDLPLGQSVLVSGDLAVALESLATDHAEDALHSLLAVAGAVEAADAVPAPLPAAPAHDSGGIRNGPALTGPARDGADELRALLDAVDCHRASPGGGTGRVEVTLEGDLLGRAPGVDERRLFALVRDVLRSLDQGGRAESAESVVLRCALEPDGRWSLTVPCPTGASEAALASHLRRGAAQLGVELEVQRSDAATPAALRWRLPSPA